MDTSNDTFSAARAHFLEGVTLLEAGCDAEAERALEAALALLPGRPSALVNLGVARLRLGRPADALAVLDQAVAAEPGQLDGWCHRGLALSALQRDADALASYERALTLDSHHAAASA